MDWGIGGLGVQSLVKKRMPDVPVIYFSDTGAVPYGKMSRGELAARLDAIIAFLKTKGVSHVVIACNAASTAIPFLDKTDVKVEGVIDCAVTVTVSVTDKEGHLLGTFQMTGAAPNTLVRSVGATLQAGSGRRGHLSPRLSQNRA